MAIMSQPINVFATLLYQVGEIARELNDDKLNALMIRLTIYEQADPESPLYDKEMCKEVMKRAYEKDSLLG